MTYNFKWVLYIVTVELRGIKNLFNGQAAHVVPNGMHKNFAHLE